MSVTTLTGSVEALTEWYQEPIQADGPLDDHIREDVLMDAHRFTAFGVKGTRVILKTPQGRTILEVVAGPGGYPLVLVDHVSSRWLRVTFRMNASSMAGFGETLRAKPELRGSFDALFLGA